MASDLNNALTVNEIARILQMNVGYVRRRFLPEMDRYTIGRTTYVTRKAFEVWLEHHRHQPKKKAKTELGDPLYILGTAVYPIIPPQN